MYCCRCPRRRPPLPRRCGVRVARLRLPAGDISSAAFADGGDDVHGAVWGSAEEKKRGKSLFMLRERGRFNPACYFVEEVISGFDEIDLYKTWVRTSVMQSPQERTTRLENMSWQIWNLAKKKKQELHA